MNVVRYAAWSWMTLTLLGGCGVKPQQGPETQPTAPSPVSPTTVSPSPTTKLGGKEVCTADISQSVFTGALCACNDVNIQGYLRTRAWNSKFSPFDPKNNAGGGPVGINHNYFMASSGANAGFTDVGGSFSVAGDATRFYGFLNVSGDLFSRSLIDVTGYTNVERNAWIGADFTNTGFATIGGDLHIGGRDRLPAVVLGKRFPGAVVIAPPCDCDPQGLLDVAGAIENARLSNDNSSAGINPALWQPMVGSSEVKLNSGSYYVQSVQAIGNLQLNVNGKVALYIGGDLDVTGRFKIELAPSAEIDIFVLGRMSFPGYVSFGDKARPSASRVYGATQGDIDLTGFQSFVGNLYVPRARVVARGFLDVWGSLYVKDLQVQGFANFAYDYAIRSPTEGCPDDDSRPPKDDDSRPPKDDCSKSRVCSGGQACIDGNCTACRTDADCNGLDVCTQGKCQVLFQ
jgi:hypothetical protein